MKALVAIFLHLANPDLWPSINRYVRNAKSSKFDLYINFCPEMTTKNKINKNKKIITNE